MEPRIEEHQGRTLVGCFQANSAGPATTAALWRTFMPQQGRIGHRASPDFISMRVYHVDRGEPFTESTPFDEWAVVEVTQATMVPEGMKTFDLTSGTYAVFVHRGPASTFPRTAGYVYGTWLPNSDYQLDARPHLAVMGPGYRPDDPNAEEELWVPVRSGYKAPPAGNGLDD